MYQIYSVAVEQCGKLDVTNCMKCSEYLQKVKVFTGSKLTPTLVTSLGGGGAKLCVVTGT